jgi:uncharacterized protein (TIGR02611 family)
MEEFLINTLRHAWRAIVAVVGFTMLLLGALMIFTPGPGWLVILLGLSVLAAEFLWARRLLKRLKEKTAEVSGAIFGAEKLSWVPRNRLDRLRKAMRPVAARRTAP